MNTSAETAASRPVRARMGSVDPKVDRPVRTNPRVTKRMPPKTAVIAGRITFWKKTRERGRPTA